MKRIIILFTTAILIFSTASSQTSGKKRYEAHKITIAPLINGQLDEPVWLEGQWLDDFTQNEPYSGSAPSQRTEFKILFDDDNLYVAIKAFDTNPDSIVNRLTRRDQADGDLAGVIIDSFHDLRTGFLFGVSSAGVKYDLLFTNDGQDEDSSWDPNWWVKTSITTEGWVSEMKIPFSQVRFDKNSGDVWGFQVVRVLYRKNETSFWQHIPKDAPGMIHLFGELSGLQEIKPRKTFDITPYGVAKAETFKAVPENPFLAKGRLSGLNGGIDAKIGVTNNMTLDLTINPDFGQVEADPSEVNLTAYESFFSEQRPFFIEGNNITNFALGIGDGGVGNDNLFYSRRIGRKPHGDPDLEDTWYSEIPTQSTIISAAKLTGKTKNGLSVGFIEAMTAEEIAEIDTVGGRKYETVEPLTNYIVGRIQKDINEGNTIIGGIFTSTNRALNDDLSDDLHKAAYTGGIDFTQYFKDKSWMFNLNTAFSLVEGTTKAIDNTQRSSARYFQRPDNDYSLLDTNRTSLAGSGGRMQIMKLDGHWNFLAATIWKTPGFETNDIGFLREADQLLNVLWVGYNQWEPKWIYRSYNLNVDYFIFNNFGGNLISHGFEWNGSMNLKNFWSIWLGGNFNSASLSPGMLRGGPMMRTTGSTHARLGFSTDSRKKLVLEVYTNGTKGYENSWKNISTGIDISYKPTNYISFTVSPGFSKSDTELQYIASETVNNTDNYIFASIDRKTINTSFRVNFNLSPDLTFQYWGQPFIASGKYSEYKYITNPMAENYKDRFSVYNDSQIEFDGVDKYNIDEDLNGVTDYSFDRKDFNVQEFLSNFVVRWEYNPGSSVFLVWSQTRDDENETGIMDFSDNMKELFTGKAHNIFLIKFSYRFGIK